MKNLGKVSSVIDYLSLLNNSFQKEPYYRGESDDFGKTKNMASLFRPISVQRKTFDESKKRRDMILEDHLTDLGYDLISKEYYSKMNNHNKIIKSNFMAYCQHHGLPTPLLDISTSPLVALYFACIDNPDKVGRVYVFDSNKFVELDQQVLKYKKKSFSLDPFSAKNSKKIIRALSEKMMGDKENYFTSYIDKTVLKNAQDYLNSSTFDHDEDWIVELKKLGPNLSDLHNLILDKDHGIFAKSEQQNVLAVEYKFYVENNILSKSVDKLVSFERIGIANYPTLVVFLVNLVRHISIGGAEFTPDIYFTVNPSVNFERIKAQSGHFIFQVSNNGLFYAGKSLQNQRTTTSFQEFGHKIKYSGVVFIDNKSEILKELDQYGINQESLFMDDDSLAKYIKWKLKEESKSEK